MKKNIFILFFISIFLFTVGCQRKEKYSTPEWHFESSTIELGSTTKIILENYEDFSELLVVIENTEIASINDNIITGIKSGKTDVTISNKNDTSTVKIQTLTVEENLPDVTFEENMMVGGLYDITIDGFTDLTDYNLSSSSDTIKIIENHILCEKVGKAIITFVNKDSNVSFSKEITINEFKQGNDELPIFNVSKNYTEINGRISIRFKNYKSIKDFDIITNIYDDENEEAISIDNNSRIVGIKPCEKEIYVRLKTNHSIVGKMNIIITSYNPTLFISTNQILVNEKAYLTISNIDKTAEKNLDDFTWASSDEGIATIENGVIVGHSIGNVVITVTSKTNPYVSSQISLNVWDNSISSIKLLIGVENEYNGVATPGSEFTLKLFDVSGQKYDLNDFTFIASDDEIIRVIKTNEDSYDGKIIATNVGYASVTAYKTGDPTTRATFSFNIQGTPNVDYVARILNLAIGEKGYVERYDPVTNQYVNDTKYNHWYNMDGAWCAMFVSWCWYHAGLSNDLLLKYCSCTAGRTWCESNGIFSYKKGYKPNSGDIIFFLSSGASHTGIVIYSDDNYVYTIEGNASNRVDVWRWSRNDARITGYGTPHYPEYNGEKSDFSWIKEQKEDGTYWWNNVPEKQEMI